MFKWAKQCDMATWTNVVATVSIAREEIINKNNYWEHRASIFYCFTFGNFLTFDFSFFSFYRAATLQTIFYGSLRFSIIFFFFYSKNENKSFELFCFWSSHRHRSKSKTLLFGKRFYFRQ